MTIYDVLSTMKSNPRSHDPPQGLGVQGSRSFAIIREKGVCMHVFVCVCVCVGTGKARGQNLYVA